MPSDVPISRFREACGATGPLTFQVEDSRTGAVAQPVVEQPFVVVGRGEGVDLVLDAPEVSRRHAYLQVIGGRLFGFDLLSRTGLRWERGDAPLGWLDPGQALEVGPFKVRVVSGLPEVPPGPDLGTDPLAVSPPGQDPLPPLTLEGVDSTGRRALWQMNRVLALVGRTPECRVRLQDDAVSRFCGSLVRTSAGAWVVDLLGQPGVVVNEQPVRWALLEDGDEVRVGSVLMRVRYGADPAGPGPSRVSLSLPAPEAASALSPAVYQAPPALPPALQAALPDGAEVPAWLVPLTSQFALMQQQMFDQFTQAMLMMGQMYSQLHREQLGLVREELERLQQVGQELRALQAELAERTQQARPAAPAVPREVPPGAPVRNGNPPAAAPAAPPRPKAAGGLSDQEIHAELSRRIAELQQERETRWQKLVGGLLGKRPGDAPR